MKNKIFIGIDPAFRKSGFAICIQDEVNTLFFKVFKDYFHFFFWFLNERPEGDVVVGVENSNLQNVTFPKSGGKRESRAVLAKRSRDVGKNQAISQAVCDFCAAILGKDKVFQFSPREKGKTIEDLKQFEKMLERGKYAEIYGYKGNKNEDDKRAAYQILDCTKRRLRLKKMLR